MESKQLTPEQQVAELMRPRYKVIADYPGSKIKVGDIYQPPDNKEIKSFWNKYPHLFQPLPWYAERDKKEVLAVKYLKNNDGVYKVKEWLYEPHPKFWVVAVWGIEKCLREEWKDFYLHTRPSLLPATETEYLEYINGK